MQTWTDNITSANERSHNRSVRIKHRKEMKMKTLLNRRLRFMILATAAVLLPIQVPAKPPLYDYEFPITNRQQAAGLKPGVKLAMACTKCKTPQVRDVDKNGAFLDWFTPNKKDICPGCGGHWGYVVYGKGKRHGDWVHTCSKCGDRSMFCCSTEPSKKTTGM
jgi:hypothetical protein